MSRALCVTLCDKLDPAGGHLSINVSCHLLLPTFLSSLFSPLSVCHFVHLRCHLLCFSFHLCCPFSSYCSSLLSLSLHFVSLRLFVPFDCSHWLLQPLFFFSFLSTRRMKLRRMDFVCRTASRSEDGTSRGTTRLWDTRVRILPPRAVAAESSSARRMW